MIRSRIQQNFLAHCRDRLISMNLSRPAMESLIVTKYRAFAGVRRTAKKSIGILFRKRPRFMKIRILESAASPPGILWFGFNDLAHFFRTCVTKWSLRNSPPRLSNSRGFQRTLVGRFTVSRCKENRRASYIRAEGTIQINVDLTST